MTHLYFSKVTKKIKTIFFSEGREDVVDIFNEQGTSGKLVVYISGGYWLVSCFVALTLYDLPIIVKQGQTVLRSEGIDK